MSREFTLAQAHLQDPCVGTGASVGPGALHLLQPRPH